VNHPVRVIRGPVTPAGPEKPGPIAYGPVRLSRRTFLGYSAVLASVGAIAPFSFVRSADTLHLARFVREQMRMAMTPGLSVAVVRGEEILWSIGAGWADHENEIRSPLTPCSCSRRSPRP
jgi:CubicO group peptidase (beta-lactamase class C family)